MKLREKCDLLRALLLEVQKHYREPNSDYYEYCNGCGRNPHNVPPHAVGCLVPRLARALKETK